MIIFEYPHQRAFICCNIHITLNLIIDNHMKYLKVTVFKVTQSNKGHDGNYVFILHRCRFLLPSHTYL